MSVLKEFAAGYISTRFKGGLDRVVEEEEIEKTAMEAGLRGLKIDPKELAQALTRSGVTIRPRLS